MTAGLNLPNGKSAAVRRLTRYLAAGLVAAAGISAPSCAGNYPELVPPAAAQATDINRQSPDKLVDGGTLRLAISAMPQNFNPLHVDSGEYLDVVKAGYPRAYTVGPDGSLAVNTDFFTDVALTSTEPPVVVYTINPNAVWSDGSPITWEDIDSQVRAMRGVDSRFETSSKTGFDRVASVTRGVDDRQALITFTQPYVEWRGMFAGNHVLLPRSMTATPGAFNEAQRDGPGPSAGPFLVSRIDKITQQITLTRNPKWWGTPPRLESITYVVPPEDQLQALRDKRIDAARITSHYDLADIRRDDGIVIRRAPQPCWWEITFNGAPGAILASKELRLAISKAIDREAIVNVQLHGLIDNPVPLNRHIFIPQQSIDQDNAAAIAYSPDQARKELDELGWKLNGDVRAKDGKQLIIRDVFGYDTTSSDLAQILKKNLASIGVKLTIDDNPENNFIVDGNFDLTQSEECTDIFTLGTMEDAYHTNGVANIGKIGNQDIDALIEQAIIETDEFISQSRANDADAMLWEECHSLPLGPSPGILAVRSNVANYGAFGVADIEYTDIGFTQYWP